MNLKQPLGRLAVVGLLAGLAFVWGCGSDDADSASDSAATEQGGGGGSGDATAGEDQYSQTCSSCHGPDAKGLPNLGKDLTTSALVADSTDEELVAFVTKGRGTDDPANTTGVAMPPKGGNPALTEDDLADIVAYLRTLQE